MKIDNLPDGLGIANDRGMRQPPLRLIVPVLACLSGAAAACGEDDKEKNFSSGIQFVMKKRPSLRAGDWLRMDFRAKVQMDVR